MTKRGWLAAGLAGLLLIGCARPGAADGSTETIAATSAPAVVLPTYQMAACWNGAATAPATTATATTPGAGPTGDGPGDAFERNQAANNSFRERRALPPVYYLAAQPCVDKVRAALAKLREKNRYDAASVEQALRGAGLTEAYARVPGRLDLGSGSGVVFSATPGAGCIVGHHGPDDTTVEYGGGVLDGGCLVAPD
jgi:hypothetical protein